MKQQEDNSQWLERLLEAEKRVPRYRKLPALLSQDTKFLRFLSQTMAFFLAFLFIWILSLLGFPGFSDVADTFILWVSVKYNQIYDYLWMIYNQFYG